jgi:hypothetical protein
VKRSRTCRDSITPPLDRADRVIVRSELHAEVPVATRKREQIALRPQPTRKKVHGNAREQPHVDNVSRRAQPSRTRQAESHGRLGERDLEVWTPVRDNERRVTRPDGSHDQIGEDERDVVPIRLYERFIERDTDAG